MSGGALTSVRNIQFLLSWTTFEGNSAVDVRDAAFAAVLNSTLSHGQFRTLDYIVATATALTNFGCGSGSGGALCYSCSQ